MGKILGFFGANPVAAVMLGAETAFWVLIALGLVFRYPLRMRRTGAGLLLGVPIVDLVLLVAIGFDLSGGASATVWHALGTAYLGFSIAFGHSMVRWADGWFAYRFARGPRPVKPPRYGEPGRAAKEWREFGKYALAVAITAAAMAALTFGVSSLAATSALWQGVMPKLLMVGLIWFLVGPVWASLSRAKVTV
ncbi:hypothetical protein [Sciscionella sediminilitoris]|uniref:hypothetical protein n=1 Tax=Sciscionella sediminilitoris TaxID=1445613 RepID=UPI0004DEF3AC|nr:hypothetical protein [Sciscionella sp. SE31]